VPVCGGHRASERTRTRAVTALHSSSTGVSLECFGAQLRLAVLAAKWQRSASTPSRSSTSRRTAKTRSQSLRLPRKRWPRTASRVAPLAQAPSRRSPSAPRPRRCARERSSTN
jgi:hypothetical protein